jgi:NAD(P)-dependent dehydrogenase (short-subunit alcohol dehydrogenase family)
MSATVVRNLQPPAQVLVTGASSGVGLAAVRQLLAHSGVARVFAVSRRATACEALRALAAQAPSQLVLFDADLTDEKALSALARQLADQTDALHLVFHAAGLLHEGKLQPEKSVLQVRASALQQVFAINAFAPILLAAAVMPLLGHGQPCVFASLSARVGSIGDNRLGGWYGYRASKTAQNQLLKTFALELVRHNHKACCLLLHPGTVDTPLSQPFQKRVPASRLFTPERAARQLLEIIAQARPHDSGCFLAWDGTTIAW